MGSHEARYGEPDPKGQGDIAIIGMACLFPGAPDLDTYWHNILSKVDAITDPPPEAWDADVFYDPGSTANDRVYCKRGGFISPLATFDPLDYGIMPLAVQGGEPDQWLALQVARAALADAGYDDDIPERHRAAVILGKGTYLNRGNLIAVQHGQVVDQTLEILKTLHPEYTAADLQMIRQQLKQSLPPFNADTAPGLIPNIIAGRIANRLDLMGPSYTVDAACASSLIAVDHAVRGLRNGEYDLALVGGAQVVTPVPVLMLFCHLGALSRREQIRPFDKDADGTILGEGVGMVVLKRREDAERDGHRIYAVIKGVGIASDGRGLSVMAPRVEGEILALRRAYETTGISPRTIGLIEAHGTGTPVGDATEVAALTQVFGPRDGARPWCALGAVKSMIGHLMPAAGIAGLIKTALALYHKVLPPTLNVVEPNPKLELDKTPFYINTETRPWIHGAQSTPRRAGINAFGFGGINAHVILEEYPATEAADSKWQIADGSRPLAVDRPSATSRLDSATVFPSHHLPWDTEVFILSAWSRTELIERIRELQQFLRTAPTVDLKDLAYTLNVERSTFNVERSTCLAVIATNIEDLQRKLGRALERLSDPQCRQIKEVQGLYYFEQPLAASGQLAFLFPGEGSQYLNMLADLCIHFPEVRKHFELIDRVFAGHTRNYVPSDFIFPCPTFSEAEHRAAEERLWQMEGAVEAVLTANRALFDLLNRLEIQPDAVVGHSTGEYSAMLASGMIELADETHVGQFAAELNRIHRQAASEGDIPRAALIAVGADRETVSSIIEQFNGDTHVAMDNCAHQTVIAGRENAAEQVVEQLRHRGLIYERLPFDRPYHTPLFEAFAARLQAFFARWLVNPPRIKTYSCTTSSPFPTDTAQIREVALEHWMRPVEFRKTIEAMYADGVRIFVEVGPRGNLTAFVDDILRGKPHIAVPADVMHRSGITQLNHLVGILAAQGVSMRLDQLYAHRSPRRLDLDRPDDPDGHGRKSRGRMKLATGWPPMHLSPETAARLQSKARELPAKAASPDAHPQAPTASASAPVSQSEPSQRPPATDGSSAGQNVSAAGLSGQAPTVVSSPARSASVTQVMIAHMHTMEQFLDVQQQIMQAFLTGRAVVAGEQGSQGAGEQGWRRVEEEDGVGMPASVHPAPSTIEAEPLPLAEKVATSLPVPVEAGTLNAEAIRDILLRLVSERTGYPIEMLDLNLDLEADLGIDSIKRVEILGSFRQQTGWLQPEEMEGLAGRKTLQEVISFLATRRVGNSASSFPFPSLPFIDTIVSLTPGEELVARSEISLDKAPFLRDHALGRQVSVTDPELRGLPVMPLTMSMEMLAEAAAVLVPGQRLIGMREVRAYRWMTLEGDRLTVELVARRNRAVPGTEIHVQVREGGEPASSTSPAPTPIVEGTMVFGEDYPEPPVADEFTLREKRPSRWRPEQLYEEGMFHGPAFRGVTSIDFTGADGAEATLQVLPDSNLFQSHSSPLITDPVLLDQPGQVVGFWTAENLETGYVIFPFRLEALHLYGPNLSASERVKCRARIALVGEQQVRSDLDIVDPAGRVWARFVGWEDRRFDLPHSFCRSLLSPRDVMLSDRWPVPVAALPEAGGFQAYRLSLDTLPEGFFTAHGGIWQRVLAYLVLSQREREQWHSLRTPEPRRLEWLLGRVVAKDAVRQYLAQCYGMLLCPADIEILPDSDGRPVAQGAWTDRVSRVPGLSLSHAGGVAVAVVGDVDGGAGVGIDIERVGRMNENMEALAFTPQERELLATVHGGENDNWPLRLWCAKEAVAKALGQGMVGGPQALVVQALDAPGGMVRVGLAGELAHRLREAEGATFTAFTAREADLIVATSVCQLSNVERSTEGRA